MALPERMCVGCRGRSDQRDLVRMVRRPDGEVVVDRSGSAPGRGAYVHLDSGCADVAVDGGALGRALRAGLTVEGAARLRSDLERLMGAV